MIATQVDHELAVHYLDCGSGPTILFLHGFNGGCGLWKPNLEDLAEQGFRCLAPDLPGWGDTIAPEGFTFQMPGLVEWLCRFLDRHTSGPIMVVGHSFGGAAALHLALAHPDRVSRLVLVCSAGLSPESIIHYRLLAIPILGEYLLKTDSTFVRKELARFAVRELAAIPEDVLAYIERVVMHPWFTKTALQWVRRNGVIWRGAAAISVRDRLGQLAQPTLLMVGERDPITSPSQTLEAMGLIPKARLSRFPDGMHLLPLDYRVEFCNQVAAFSSGA